MRFEKKKESKQTRPHMPLERLYRLTANRNSLQPA